MGTLGKTAVFRLQEFFFFAGEKLLGNRLFKRSSREYLEENSPRFSDFHLLTPLRRHVALLHWHFSE